jgi:hypothetical protein
MTDETEPAAVGPDDEQFVIVPSAKWALELERRVGEAEGLLEGLQAPASQPSTAQLAPEVEQQILDALRGISGRLERHRADIDALKTQSNQLVEYVKSHTPAAAPATEGSVL